jgi:uncharacterized protein (DUF849 family)
LKVTISLRKTKEATQVCAMKLGDERFRITDLDIEETKYQRQTRGVGRQELDVDRFSELINAGELVKKRKASTNQFLL